MNKKIIEKVLEASGGTAKLAKYLKISSQAVSQWSQIPVDRVLQVEELTAISRHELRPDIYGSAA